jgi:hypothetical protein
MINNFDNFKIKEMIRSLSEKDKILLFTMENYKDLPDSGLLGDLKKWISDGEKNFTLGKKINKIERIILHNLY